MQNLIKPLKFLRLKMKKLLLLALFATNIGTLFGWGAHKEDLDFESLKNAVKNRSLELKTKLFDLRDEHCLTKALSRRILDLAESTKLFLQDVEYCQEAKSKKKADLNRDKCIRKLNKSIIPELLKINRRVDRLDQTIDSIFEKKKVNRREFFKAIDESARRGKKPKSTNDSLYKKFINLGKAFKGGIDNAAQVSKELVGIQVDLINKRKEILAFEELHLKFNGDHQNELMQADLESNPWSIGDWISSIFGKQEEGDTKTTNDLKEEFDKVQKERKATEKKLLKIESEVKKAPSNHQQSEPQKVSSSLNPGFDELDLQIKSLGESIQKLSANIDAQLEDLERLTKNIANETLSKIEL